MPLDEDKVREDCETTIAEAHSILGVRHSHFFSVPHAQSNIHQNLNWRIREQYSRKGQNLVLAQVQLQEIFGSDEELERGPAGDFLSDLVTLQRNCQDASRQAARFGWTKDAMARTKKDEIVADALRKKMRRQRYIFGHFGRRLAEQIEIAARSD